MALRSLRKNLEETMNQEGKSKFKPIMAIFMLVVVIAIAIITTCILNSKKRELDDINNKNDQIEETISDKQFFQKMF